MKKLLNAEGRRSVTIDPKKIHKPAETFAPPAYIRVCNASSKEPYRTPVWPSARASRADDVASVGVPC